jgi:demethylmenaquinone methyltransferase/2-methoxy-6-polyprenyl-1,4-benzoquinol methylase
MGILVMTDLNNKDAGRVAGMFDGIARRYDLANHLLSGGVDFLWRRLAVRLSGAKKGDVVLDMCCGTGDLAFCFAKHSQPARVVGCDFSAEMVRLARLKAEKQAKKGKFTDTEFEWSTADCTATAYADETYDIISCGFGVRNMADLDSGLTEMYRLLKTGGRVCIIEFTLPKCVVCRTGYLSYLRYILPIFGGIITGKLSAYRYFADSIVKWDKEVDLAKSLEAAGLKKVTVKPLSKGIAAIYVFEKT